MANKGYEDRRGIRRCTSNAREIDMDSMQI